MNFRLKRTLILLPLLSISILSFAQKEQNVQDLGEYVVTANRVATPIEKSGKVIYQINAEDIKKQPGKTVGELLNALPGINIDGAFGTPGSNLSYNIRGGRNGDILIFELNPAMRHSFDHAKNFPYMAPYMHAIKDAFSNMVKQKSQIK